MTASQELEMTKSVTINWSEGVEIEDEFFQKDLLGREKYAGFLTNHLLGQNKEKPYVLNLNSGWGTGKTYFLKRWKYDLEKCHPVIYIDAWKNDHSDDPFMTVVSAIISTLRESTDKPESSLLSKGAENSWLLLKAMGPLIVGAAAKKILGKDIDELASLVEGDSPDISKEVGDAAAKMAQFLISSHEKRAESVKALKADIIGWIDTVVGQGNGIVKPTFVIIDELDRCRPSFAVEMLEAVKHIFDIPGIFFIIATDTEQLQHAIKVVYGNDFDAQTYLSRFFDSRFSLRESSLKSLIEANCDLTVFSNEYLDQNRIVLWPRNISPLDNIVSVLESFSLSPREAIQVVHRIAATIVNLKKNRAVDIIYITILHCLKIKDPHIYDGVVGTSTMGDYRDVFKSKDYFNSEVEIGVMLDRNSRGVISISLNKYFSSIFLYNSNVFLYDADDNVKVKKKNASHIEEEIRQLRRGGGYEYDDERLHILYLQCEYLDVRLHRDGKTHYKDFIELATSFD